MKTLLFAAAVLVASVIYVAWSGWYMEELCTTMRNMVEAMPDGDDRSMEDFNDSYRAAEVYWLKRKLCIQMIIGKKRMEEVFRKFVEMGMRYIGGDISGYMAGKEGLMEYLEQIGSGEKVSWNGIL
ncbi:MAG: hypothetical protein IKY52_08510 [Clostridia bacterium]|nr:hypothetical protein [Clostridia bacterium]